MLRPTLEEWKDSVENMPNRVLDELCDIIENAEVYACLAAGNNEKTGDYVRARELRERKDRMHLLRLVVSGVKNSR